MQSHPNNPTHYGAANGPHCGRPSSGTGDFQSGLYCFQFRSDSARQLMQPLAIVASKASPINRNPRFGRNNHFLESDEMFMALLSATNDRTDRRGRPVMSELATDATRPRSGQ
jgi:hypothetical protein